jgi:dihydroorotase
MVGLESALRVVQQSMVDTGLITWGDVARVMSREPARIGRLTGHGTPLTEGQPASLAFYDPSPRRAFTTDDLRGRSVNSPYLGRELPGDVRWTLHQGTVTVADGALLDTPGVRA